MFTLIRIQGGHTPYTLSITVQSRLCISPLFQTSDNHCQTLKIAIFVATEFFGKIGSTDELCMSGKEYPAYIGNRLVRHWKQTDPDPSLLTPDSQTAKGCVPQVILAKQQVLIQGMNSQVTAGLRIEVELVQSVL